MWQSRLLFYHIHSSSAGQLHPPLFILPRLQTGSIAFVLPTKFNCSPLAFESTHFSQSDKKVDCKNCKNETRSLQKRVSKLSISPKAVIMRGPKQQHDLSFHSGFTLFVVRSLDLLSLLSFGIVLLTDILLCTFYT